MAPLADLDPYIDASDKQGEDLASSALVASIEREYMALPEIRCLDEYTHFRGQLKSMRARGGEFITERFGMEFALLMRINEFDRRIGVPEYPMPGSDGEGGLIELSVIPEGWL